MKPNQVVLTRFEELLNKAKDVEASKKAEIYDIEMVDRYKFEEWAISAMALLHSVFGDQSIHYTNFFRHYDGSRGYLGEFELCRSVFKAAKEDYQGGYLFRLKSLVSAEVLDDALEQAEELLTAGYKDPACVVAGVALETALRHLCSREGIPKRKLDRMNTDLCKAEVYKTGLHKQIAAWADRRNKAAHGDWDEYTSQDVNDMIGGVRRFIAEYL